MATVCVQYERESLKRPARTEKAIMPGGKWRGWNIERRCILRSLKRKRARAKPRARPSVGSPSTSSAYAPQDESYIVRHGEKKSQHAWANNGGAPPPLTWVQDYARAMENFIARNPPVIREARKIAFRATQAQSSPASRLAANSQKRLTLCGSGRSCWCQLTLISLKNPCDLQSWRSPCVRSPREPNSRC